MHPEQAQSWTGSSNPGAGELPAPMPPHAGTQQQISWRPRPSASHLSRGPNGVYYVRLTIPDRVRRLRPDLPRELRRSTHTTAKQPALRHARQICEQLMTSLNNAGTAMLVTDSAAAKPRPGFLIEYVDGRLRTDLYQGAGPEVRRLYLHLVEAAAGFEALAAPVLPAPASSSGATVSPALSAAAVSPAAPMAAWPPAIAPTPATAVEADRVASVLQAAQSPPAPQEPELGDIWLSDAIQDWRQFGPHTFQGHTWLHAYRPSFRVFRELVGNTRRDIIGDSGEIEHAQLDIRCRDLTPEHMRQFHQLLQRLPQRQGKRDDGVEALDLILAADAQERTVKKLGEKNRPRQSHANIIKKLEHVKPFIGYMLTKEWISSLTHSNFLLELKTASANQSEARKYSKDPKPGAIRLTADDLRSTFQSPAYIAGASQCDWKYWLPPILLYSGTRVSEPSQLYTNDIIHVLGIPCFSFVWDTPGEEDEEECRLGDVLGKAKTEAEFRRLKNRASRRIIPIHPELLKLGFMEWVERRRTEVGPAPGLLFKELRWEQKSGYGRKPSEHVLDLLKASGVWIKRKKVCHSLRATCVQELRRVGMPKDERQRYIGHSTLSQEDESYGETEQGPNCPAQQMLKYLTKTTFGVTFPPYAEIRALQIERARSEQLGRKNSAARRRIEAGLSTD